MGGAIEGCIHNIPSIGFSLNDYDPEAIFPGQKFTLPCLSTVAENDYLRLFAWMWIFRKARFEGFRFVSKQRKWVEEFEKRTDPHTREYYWMSGYFENHEEDIPGTDIHALENGYVSVVPVNADMTCYQTFETWKAGGFNMSPGKKPYDQILTGWLIGMISPIIIFLIIYQLKYSEMEFAVYVRISGKWNISENTQLCVFPTWIFLPVLRWIRYGARGVIMATFMYAFVVLIAKLI